MFRLMTAGVICATGLGMGVCAIASTQTPNPAAEFCIDQGGTFKVIESADGQTGICTLSDGREVDAWTYFREHHGQSD